MLLQILSVFFCNDTATTEIYTLSLHDALPICEVASTGRIDAEYAKRYFAAHRDRGSVMGADRKSTRLNSSHSSISYAVFCLKKKNNIDIDAPGREETIPHATAPKQNHLPKYAS